MKQEEETPIEETPLPDNDFYFPGGLEEGKSEPEEVQASEVPVTEELAVEDTATPEPEPVVAETSVQDIVKQTIAAQQEEQRKAAQVAQAEKVQKPKSIEEMSDEELDQLTNPHRVSAEDFTAMFGIDEPTKEQVASMQEFVNRTVNNATSISAFVAQEMFRQLQSQIQPVVQQSAASQQEQIVNEFFTTYPALKSHARIAALVAPTVNPIKPDGSRKNAQEIYSDVALATMETLKQSGVQLETNGKAEQATPTISSPQRTSVPAMASVLSPGRSQGGKLPGQEDDVDYQADMYKRR